jgi:hypothetical protein
VLTPPLSLWNKKKEKWKKKRNGKKKTNDMPLELALTYETEIQVVFEKRNTRSWCLNQVQERMNHA